MSLSLIPIKKTKSFTKYSYSSNDNINNSYLFVIELECPKKKYYKKIQKISTEKNYYILNEDDKILFKKFTKIKLEITKLSNIDQSQIIEIDLNSNNLISKNNFIYLEVINKDDFLLCYYNIEPILLK